MNKPNTICIDLAKTVFQVALFNKHGKLQSNQKMSQKQMVVFIAKYPGALICMEACATAHFWGRKFQKSEHTVQLIPAQIVRKYRSGNKNDANDTLAIYEAAQRSDVHFVQVKTTEQQDISSVLKLRESYIKQRTATANRIRGFAMEYGVKFPQSINKLRKLLPFELESTDNALTPSARFILNQLSEQLIALDKPIQEVTDYLIVHAKHIPACQLLMTLRGVGWIVASALYSRLGDASSYKCGRDASASIGLVPAHTGSGGSNKLLGISKSGDRTMRSLLVHGARSVVCNIKNKTDVLSCWIRQLLERNHLNKVVVALANKTVRMACAMLKSNQPYQEKLPA